jgi:ABC-2 type transport system ATP-binding protein
MDAGRILELDTPEALRRGEAGSVLEVLARPRRTAQEMLAKHPEVTDLETFGERLHATLSRTPREEAAAAAERLTAALRAAGVEVEAIRPVLPSLEDIFIARMRRSA